MNEEEYLSREFFIFLGKFAKPSGKDTFAFIPSLHSKVSNPAWFTSSMTFI